MGSGWTGKAGEPVPAMLRHRRATDPTRGAPDGRCACGLPLAPGERARPTDLCPVAVSQHIADLEGYLADIHRRVGRGDLGSARANYDCILSDLFASGQARAEEREEARQRIAELEAHEASVTDAVGRARREVVRWLRRDLDQLWERATNPRLTEHAQSVAIGAREALALASEGVAAGHDAEWCEANPEPSPAHEDTP